jgi:hypothetical protein
VAAVTIAPRRLGALALLGLAIVLAARWIAPEAPALYDGFGTPAPPYQYCNPPPDLKSTNKPPTGGSGDLPIVNGLTKIGTVETEDKQVVAFFAQGVFKLQTGSVHITVDPVCTSPPPPPPHSTYVGNDYRITATLSASGGETASPPPVVVPAQILLRVPPVAYNVVRVYYNRSWHDTEFGAQTDLVNVSLSHLGNVAAFNDTSLRNKAKPPSTFNFATVFEVVLTIAALLIIVAGIIAQSRRGTRPDRR